MISAVVPRFVRGTPMFVFLLVVMGSLMPGVESFALVTPSGTSTATALQAAASFEDLRKAFPENPDIVAAGGYHHLETLAKADPKAALVDLVVDGLKGGASAVQPKTDKTAAIRINEKLEALSLLLYGMGKGFSADTIDGEWDLVFAKQGQKSPSFQKLVGKTEKAGKSKNIFDVRSMIFHGNVRFWKWGKVSSSVKVRSQKSTKFTHDAKPAQSSTGDFFRSRIKLLHWNESNNKLIFFVIGLRRT